MIPNPNEEPNKEDLPSQSEDVGTVELSAGNQNWVTGVITKVNFLKAFGFIRTHDGVDVYFWFPDLSVPNYNPYWFQENMPVRCIPEDNLGHSNSCPLLTRVIEVLQQKPSIEEIEQTRHEKQKAHQLQDPEVKQKTKQVKKRKFSADELDDFPNPKRKFRCFKATVLGFHPRLNYGIAEAIEEPKHQWRFFENAVISSSSFDALKKGDPVHVIAADSATMAEEVFPRDASYPNG